MAADPVLHYPTLYTTPIIEYVPMIFLRSKWGLPDPCVAWWETIHDLQCPDATGGIIVPQNAAAVAVMLGRVCTGDDDCYGIVPRDGLEYPRFPMMSPHEAQGIVVEHYTVQAIEEFFLSREQ